MSNGMLAKAAEKDVGLLFIVMILVQTCIPAIHSACMNGGMSPSKIIGFAFALIAAILLTK